MHHADTYEEGYPHGSVTGFVKGCRSASCIYHGDPEWLSCKEAIVAFRSDFTLRNHPADQPIPRSAAVIEKAPRSTAKPAAPKHRPASPIVRPETAVTSIEEPTPIVDETTESTSIVEEAEAPGGEAGPAPIASPGFEVFLKPGGHGTNARYQKGCRVDEECPNFGTDQPTCPEPGRKYRAEYKARKDAEREAKRLELAKKAEERRGAFASGPVPKLGLKLREPDPLPPLDASAVPDIDVKLRDEIDVTLRDPQTSTGAEWAAAPVDTTPLVSTPPVEPTSSTGDSETSSLVADPPAEPQTGGEEQGDSERVVTTRDETLTTSTPETVEAEDGGGCSEWDGHVRLRWHPPRACPGGSAGPDRAALSRATHGHPSSRGRDRHPRGGVTI